MNLVYKSLKFLKSLSIILIISFFLSLIIDFFFGKYILKSLDSYLQKTEFYERILRTDHPVFHHSFLSNVNYKKSKGFEGIYTFCTDNHGFRSECGKINSKNFDIGFMGDSFVEGVSLNYEDTFVGLFAKSKKKFKVANLGISSYAPSIYFSKLKYLLENNYNFKHIIFFIDISDLYDDSVLYKLNEDGTVFERYEKEKGLKRRKFLRSNFPLTNYYMYVIKKNSQLKNDKKKIEKFLDVPLFNKKASIKAEWTFYGNNDHPDYNIGIKESQKVLINNMEKAYKLLNSKNIKMSVAVYPWPQQIQNDVINSKHVKMWKDFCYKKCEKFINFFPFFFEEKEKSSFLDVYKKYFFWNDVHFNSMGNKMIAKKLLEIF